MGRANLPNLSHRNLRNLLGTRPTAALGYKTYVETVAGSAAVDIVHHQTVIATVDPTGVRLNATHDSITTAHRLDRVLTDNGFTHRVAIRNRETALLNAEGKIVTPSLHWIDARHVAAGVDAVTAGL